MAEKLNPIETMEMKRAFIKIITLIIILNITLNINIAFGWHDETHLSVAKAAGYYKWYNSAGPDIAKLKASYAESYNHWFDNTSKVEITTEMVLDQTERYNNPKDKGGHLYGAIIASLRKYKETVKTGKYAEYHISFCAHYIADLSQPFHNFPYDDFNRKYHVINDGIIEDEVLENISKIRENVYLINLRPERFEEDLAREIARISNLSRELGYILKKENRNMTKGEAYIQLGHSVSLLRAILKYLGKLSN